MTLDLPITYNLENPALLSLEILSAGDTYLWAGYREKEKG